MKRKLVKQGNGALTITLPYQWISRSSLKKGDYLDLKESGKDLILSCESHKTNKSYTIDISTQKPFFKRYIRSCYILGYDSITVQGDEVLPNKQIKEALENLIGYEIIEQTTKKCTISMVASGNEENTTSVMKRLFFMIDSMVLDMLDALKARRLDSLKEIAEVEDSINSLVDFCLRVLNKSGYTEYRKTPYIYQLISLLEQIGDALRDLCLSLSIHGSSKKTLTLLKTTYSYFVSLRELFYRYDMRKIREVKEKRLYLLDAVRSNHNYLGTGALDLYLIVSILHQFEIALDPLNN